MTILEAYDRWKKLSADQIRAIGMDTLKELKDEYIELQRKQMEFGQDNEGKRIGVYSMWFGTVNGKTDYYGNIKHDMNPLPGLWNVDLKLTGKFYQGITIDLKDKEHFEVYSTDPKNDILVEKYGISIFLLNPKFLALFQAKFRPQFNLKIKEFLSAA